MPFAFDPNACLALFAHEYLCGHRDRGRPFSLKRLGLTFHRLKDCLCLGFPWQVLLPVHGDTLPYLLRDSCPYLANEHKLPGLAAAGLNARVTGVDEAAPFFPPGADNLWHWMTESLPQLLALEEAGYDGLYIVPEGSRVVDESLALLGIDPGRLLRSGGAYRVRRLVVPPRLSGFSLAENMPLTAFLRQRLLEAAGTVPGGGRWYVRRVGTRRIANEEDLLPVLDDFGFTAMVPEELPLKEQLRAMTGADCSLMAHGANCSLVLMQRPGSVFVELFGNRYVSYNNMHAVRLLRLRYHALAEDLDPSSCADPAQPVGAYLAAGSRADITVDPLHARIVLETALAPARKAGYHQPRNTAETV